MPQPPKPPPAPTARGAEAGAKREARLAAALRANLGRRKAQARRRADPLPPAEPRGRS
jgi:hypothetical protein